MSERLSSIFAGIVRAIVAPRLDYPGPPEFRVVSQSGDLLDLEPTDPSMGLPPLVKVPMRPGVAGSKATVVVGSTVLVGFINNNPARPFISHFETPGGGGYTPTNVTIDADEILLGEGLGAVIREGDTVKIDAPAPAGALGIITVTLGLGAPPAKSKVKA